MHRACLITQLGCSKMHGESERANEQTPGMAVTPLMPGSIDENHGIQIQNRKALTEVSPSNSALYRTAVVLYRGTEYAVAGI